MLAIMMMSSFGLFFVPLIAEFDTNLDEIAMAGNIMYGATYITVTLASPVCDMLGCRIIMYIGAVLLAGAFFIGYLLLNIYTFFAIGAIAGLGGGLSIASSLMAFRGYFEKKRHIALALIFVANGTGSVIGPPITTFLLNEFGLRGTCMMLSGIYLHGAIGGALLRPLPPNPFQKAPQQKERTVRLLCAVVRAYGVYIDKALLRSFLFYLCIISSYLYVIGFVVTYSRLPDYMTTNTYSLEEASTALLLAGAANTLGKMVGMLLVDKRPSFTRYFYICACVLSGGSLTSIPLCMNVFHFYAASAGFGFFFGNIHYLGSMLFIEFFGPSKLSGCFGMLYLSYTVASFTGNPLAGMVADRTSFDGAEFFFIGSCIIAAGFVLIPSVFVTTNRSILHTKTETPTLESPFGPSEISDIDPMPYSRIGPLEITESISYKAVLYGAISLPA
ncbi:monocarboxylate transporter 9-like isoform X2 [Mizuhopecten yessoensis]|nr:monocarboxylate transporter 9-like isoform X2 [Mizuhopecten yessoensis]